jgi:transcriptional regulator with XRE-family HTH domain
MEPVKVTVNISRFWRDGMTVAQVAQDLNMNTRSITALRKGTEKGDWATLVKLSRYFKVPIDELLEIDADSVDSSRSKAAIG